VPGRKTDVTDSEWIAELHRSGLIRPSYVPEEEFQELRSLTRHRTHLVRDLTRVKNRVQRVLEDGNVKLASVISDVFGVGGLAVLRAIGNKITSPKRLAECIQTDVKAEKEVLRKSLSNCLTRTHCFEVREYLAQYDGLQQCLQRLNAEIDERMEKYSVLIEKLDEIPGIDKIGAQIIVAEATTNMDAFGDDRRFAAWSGVAPGNKQSARKKKRAKIRKGNPNLKCVLVNAAKGASRTKNSYYRAKHQRLTFQLGSRNKATIAIANRICRAIYHIIRDPDCRYKDMGQLRVDSVENQIRRKINQLRALGLTVNYSGGENIHLQNDAT
jgi:transposase